MEEIDRTRRVAELIKRELAMLMSRELNDSRISGATITGVTVSRDLKHSTVYISNVDNSIKPAFLEQQLNKAAKFLRRLLSQKMQMRTTPALVFKYDSSIKRGVEMTNLIASLNKKSDSDESKDGAE